MILDDLMKKLSCVIIIFLLLMLPSVSFALFLGPYTGKIIDSKTEEPVQGVSVLMYWTKTIPTPAGGYSELIKTKLVYTDKNGRYDIPFSIATVGLLAFFESTNVIIYQPGYQAYIVKIWHDNYRRTDTSFNNRNNIIKLNRILPNFSHKKHYEQIEDALDGIDVYPYIYPNEADKWMNWKKFIEISAKTLARDELLRRAEWEERRGNYEN